MSIVDDIKAAIAQETSDEQKLISVLEATLASNKSLADQLAAATANNDPTALQSVLDSINANNKALEDELAVASPPTSATTP